jgi:hypothetical protein
VGPCAGIAEPPHVRCNVGDQYICTDGPVFRYDQIQHFLEAF